jgi:hypothetical protein
VFKAWKIYERGRLVYQDVDRLREVMDTPVGIETLDRADPLVRSLQIDLRAFGNEASPLLWLSPRLAWVPLYGGDLAAAPDLLAMAEHLVDAAALSLEAARPFLSEFASPDSTLGPAGLTALLVQAQPQLLEAHEALNQAIAARSKIEVEKLSPRVQTPLVGKLDPLLGLADEGLSLASRKPICCWPRTKMSCDQLADLSPRLGIS